jgi:hypothetical protein
VRGRAIRFLALLLSAFITACAPTNTAAQSPTLSPTTAPTTAATPTPDPSRCGATPTGTTGTLLLYSDLTDRCPAIGSGEDSQSRGTHTANGFLVILKGGPTYEMAGGPDPPVPTDVRIEVDVEESAAGGASLFGILCRVTPGRVLMAYQLLVARDGAYAIERRGGSSPKTLAEGKAPAAPRTGVNRVRADCIGSNLTLYLNGQLVATAQDTEFAGLLTGIFARSLETSGAELVFRNIVITTP